MVNGLKFLHLTANGIVHGNMKPSNVLIDVFGNIRLSDFGIVDVCIYLVCKFETMIIFKLFKLEPLQNETTSFNRYYLVVSRNDAELQNRF